MTNSLSIDIEESMNMLELNIEQFTNEIKEQFEDGNYKPMLGLGKSGVGKTQSIKELARELGIAYCELRLVTMTETDMLGIPYIVEYKGKSIEGNIQFSGKQEDRDKDAQALQSLSDKERELEAQFESEQNDKRTTYASNDLLPSENRDGKEGILVLDEITSATSTIRAAAYQLLDSQRSLGNYHLPEKWKVIALGNGVNDGGTFNGIESAFISRCMAFRIRPDYDVWRRWAVKSNINPTIIAFLDLHRGEHFYNLYEDEGAAIFPCPRTWEELSDVLNAREKRAAENGDSSAVVLDQKQVEIKASGAVGMVSGQVFASFYQLKNKVTISPKDVVEGRAVSVTASAPGQREFKLKKPLDTTDISVLYIAANTISKILEERLSDFNYSQFNKASNKDKLKYLEPVANVFSWILAVSKESRDQAVTLYSIIFVNSKNSKKVVLQDSFRQILPEYVEFTKRLHMDKAM